MIKFSMAVIVSPELCIVLFYIINNLTGGVSTRSIEVPTVEGLEYTSDAELGFNEDFTVTVRNLTRITFISLTTLTSAPPTWCR